MDWHTTSQLPDDEPNSSNAMQYETAQLMSGASADGQFIYDVVYAQAEQCFVLTLMQINDEWGFIEQQRRLYPVSRAALLRDIAAFETDPLASFAE